MAKFKVKAEFNSIFEDVNDSKHRYRILKGSAGSGKSVNIAQDYLLKLSQEKYRGTNLLVLRKVEGSNRNSTFAELVGAINRIYGKYASDFWDVKLTPLMITSKKTGNSIIFRGMNDPTQREKVKSITFPQGKLTWIWIEEATELTNEDVDTLDDRLRGILDNPNLYYQITMTFNPINVNHWLKTRFFDNDRPEFFTHHSTYLDNRFMDPGFYRRMELRKEFDPDGYKVYGLGEWGELGGLIFTHYQVHEFDVSPEKFDSMNIGQDFGYNHANAILTVGFKDSEIYVCDEIYVHDMDTDEIIEIANKRGLSKRIRMLCDSAEPDRIKTWRKAGYSAVKCVKNPGSVNAQIDYIKKHALHIHAANCPNTLKEVQQWKWIKDRKTGLYIDTPTDIFNDAMAALRYSISEKVGGSRARIRFL